MSLQIGQQLGSYEITSLIGKGGMGEVFSAIDTREGLNRRLLDQVTRAAHSDSPGATGGAHRSKNHLVRLIRAPI